MKYAEEIGAGIGMIGVLMMAASTLTGVGRWLYLWAGSMPIGAAMWNGFLLFLSMLGVGLALIILGLFIKEM